MSQTFKVYLTLFIFTVFTLIALGAISADTNVMNARAYHNSMIKEIEESNMSQTVIDSCKSNAATLGYVVKTTNIVDDKNKVIAVEVELDYTYKISILNVVSPHTLRSIAR